MIGNTALPPSSLPGGNFQKDFFIIISVSTGTELCAHFGTHHKGTKHTKKG